MDEPPCSQWMNEVLKQGFIAGCGAHILAHDDFELVTNPQPQPPESTEITCVSLHTLGIKCLQRLCYRLGTLMWIVESKLACDVAIPKEIGLLKQKGLQMLKTEQIKGDTAFTWCDRWPSPLQILPTLFLCLLSFNFLCATVMGVVLNTVYYLEILFVLVWFLRWDLSWTQCRARLTWTSQRSSCRCLQGAGLKMWSITPQCQQFYKTYFIGVYKNI